MTSTRCNLPCGVSYNLMRPANKETFSDFDMQARVLNQAPLHVVGSINPFTQQPTFDEDNGANPTVAETVPHHRACNGMREKHR